MSDPCGIEWRAGRGLAQYFGLAKLLNHKPKRGNRFVAAVLKSSVNSRFIIQPACQWPRHSRKRQRTTTAAEEEEGVNNPACAISSRANPCLLLLTAIKLIPDPWQAHGSKQAQLQPEQQKAARVAPNTERPVVLANMATHYLEKYIESVTDLPAQLQRKFRLIRDLDEKSAKLQVSRACHRRRTRLHVCMLLQPVSSHPTSFSAHTNERARRLMSATNAASS